MKAVDVKQFAANAHRYLIDSCAEPVVGIRSGRPRAVVRGLDYDDERLELINSPEFWAMISARRERPTIPWEVAEQELGLIEE